MATTLATRRFTPADQLAFARLSGDSNPIHLDPIAARRTVAGQCIVHGMHSLLWALNALARASVMATRVNVRFLKPIFLDEEVSCAWDDQAGKLVLAIEGTKVIDITLGTGTGPVSVRDVTPPAPAAARNQPAQRTFNDCARLPPQPFELHGEPDMATELFPDAVQAYGPTAIHEIAALSYVVGMELPGMNSLFAGLQLEIRPALDQPPSFTTIDSDERFNRLRIGVTGRALQGEIEAFYRPPPMRMPSSSDLIPRVLSGEFQGVCALVIGGSRGLGEVTAKLIAAGGGAVIMTYSAGAEEARQVAEDILKSGGQCKVLPLTVSDATSLPPGLPGINQLYYFATPKIFGKRTSRFDETLYQKFLTVYVNGFESICKQLIASGNRFSALYPSSVAIEQPLPELAEYAKAKAEGEALCMRLTTSRSRLDILTPRLPRTATDQTQALLQTPASDPVEVMLPLIRRMADLSNTTGTAHPKKHSPNAV